MSKIIYFVYKSSEGNGIGFYLSSVYWTSKGKRKSFFAKARLIKVVTSLIKQCYFTVGNLLLKQDIGTPIQIYPNPFEMEVSTIFNLPWFYRAYHFHSVGRFIDDIYAIDDRKEFLSS